MEMTLIAQAHCSLHDIDETDIESLYGLAGYMARKDGTPGSASVTTSSKDTMILHGKVYRRVSADKASWAR